MAHFNHCLRGASSDADERFVKKVARRLGVKCVVARGHVKDFASAQKVSVEMAARKLRHEFLASTARELRIGTIALAHHADDQVELFFLRLLRGASPSGLAGMKWRASSPADARVAIVRPLLGIGKKVLECYAGEQGVAFREDATNRQPAFLRNRIRGELLPLLESKYQPALSQVVLRAMDLLGAESELSQRAAADWCLGGRMHFDQLPIAVQRCVLERELVASSVEPEFGLIEQLRIQADVPVTISPGELITRNLRGRVRRRKVEQPEFRAEEVVVNLGVKGSVKFGDVSLKWEIVPASVAQKALRMSDARSFAKRCEYFDADKIGKSLILRRWRAGDQFQPIGMSSPVKLQDWFVNRKVSRARRHDLAVAAAADGRIFWVEDQRISEAFKLDNVTTRSLKWRWSRP